MILEEVKKKYVPRNNDFYLYHYHRIIYVLMVIIVLMMVAVGVVFYQNYHRPLPTFQAVQPNGNVMELTPFQEPNLQPETLLRWASKAAIAAYTFDLYNYNDQIAAVRPYFTDAGWSDYLLSVRGVIDVIVQNQLFVNSVVSGTPVISNQGFLPGQGYAWRIQIPLLVSYQSANMTTQRTFLVALTIVRVPTHINPQGIGIDQFVMR